MTRIVGYPPAAHCAYDSLIGEFCLPLLEIVRKGIRIQCPVQIETVEEFGHFLSLVRKGPIGKIAFIVNLVTILQPPESAVGSRAAGAVQRHGVSALSIGRRRIFLQNGVQGIVIVIRCLNLRSANPLPFIIADMCGKIREVIDAPHEAGHIPELLLIIQEQRIVLAHGFFQVSSQSVHIRRQIHSLVHLYELLHHRKGQRADDVRIVARCQRQVHGLRAVACDMLDVELHIELLLEILDDILFSGLLPFRGRIVPCRVQNVDDQGLLRDLPAELIDIARALCTLPCVP